MGIIRTVTGHAINLGVFVWDLGLFALNLVTRDLPADSVIPEGCPGYHGVWPPYSPPEPGDSRSACPMLNAMANHGILPHSGRDISFREMNIKIRQTFNFASSFCFFVPKFSADFLNRSYWSDKFDLEELSLHANNAIEHDASLTRKDLYFQPDQGKPDLKLVHQLLAEATAKTVEGRPLMTVEDLSRALSKRRADARRTNPEYSESFFHNTFGSANSATMLTIFGGRIDDLEPMLTEERFAEKWQPRILKKHGLTMAAFNGTVLPVEHGIDVKKYQ